MPNWGWPLRFLSASVYDQGHQDGYQEGYKEGQDWGHEHGACEHTHPIEEALAALGHKKVVTMDEYQAAREKQGHENCAGYERHHDGIRGPAAKRGPGFGTTTGRIPVSRHAATEVLRKGIERRGY